MSQVSGSRSRGVLLLIILGLLTAFDSLGIDMYLPAFEAMEAEFSVSPGTMSISLSSFMLGLAAGQGLCGPLADSFGRKKPLFAGIVLFAAASALAACASTYETLVAARFLQGIGGAAGLVIPRTITSDLYDEKQAASVFTVLMQVQSVCPILAPVLGAYILTHVAWQGVFWILAFFGLAGAIMILAVVPETMPARTASASSSFSADLRTLLSCRRYWLMTIAFSMLMGALFSYISSSSFIYVTLFSATATEYSLCFGLNSIGLILFGLASLRMLKTMPLSKMLRLSFFIESAAALMLLALSWTSSPSLIFPLIFLAIAAMGLLFGPLTSEVMYAVPSRVFGLASACLGVLQYAAASLASAVIGLLRPESLIPIAGVLLLFSIASALLWLSGSRTPKPAEMLGKTASIE